ncbi:hypothetical protein P885DRAFT_67114 [Corynascus similis CBS 632.67]
MDAQSPPKRMTRARAAAKTSEPATKGTRVITAAAKAKTARSASTTTTTTRKTLKRKTPSDDEEDDLEMQPAKKMTVAAVADNKLTRGRGRPRKVAVEQSAPEPTPEPAPATTVRTRGRPKKVVETPAEEPVKSTRTARAKKTTAEETKATAAEPVKRATRGRQAASAGTTATTTTTKSLTKPAVKKTVKFEEPEKENIAPTSTATRKASTKTSTPAATTNNTTTTNTGLRAKPVRTRVARSTKTAKGTSSGEIAEKPMPLSPKKVNQLTMNCIESDDELGMDEKVPVRRFKKLPIKPTTGSIKPTTVHTPAPGENDENAIPAKQPQTEINHMLATPAKRLPPTPWKGSIQSPAKRVEGLVVASAQQTEGKTPQIPSKVGLLQSPAKRQPLNLNPHGSDSNGASSVSPVKLSFLSSPAKRPPISPIKPLPRTIEEEEPMNQTPAPKPTLFASPLPREVSDDLQKQTSEVDAKLMDNEDLSKTPTRLDFPGRLSAVLPRHADPALTPPGLTGAVDATQDQVEQGQVDEVAEENNEIGEEGEPMTLDQPSVEPPSMGSASTTPPASPKNTNPMFGLREKDLHPYDQSADSESEDDSPVRQSRFTSAFSALPATPCPASTKTSKLMQSVGRSTAKKTPKGDNLGFTPLAQQLSGWTAGPTPLRRGSPADSAFDSPAIVPTPRAVLSPVEPAQNTFFEDEMHIRPETMNAEEDAVTEVGEDDQVVLEDLSFTEEDIELAAEANEMSLMEKDQRSHDDEDHDDSISEASQEYGDENAVPIDPTLASGNGFSAPAVPPVTPRRTIRREAHTVSKVPLKPADESTPRPRLEGRSHSASRLPVSRPSERLTRNATVPSYSPSKGAEVGLFDKRPEQSAGSVPPVTPQKGDIWSTMGTPARTPRRDLNPALLQGAVVFVDVHTSEGADASSIFVELLTQMGARCVKTWSWNPNHSSESGADSRVGITHVVYKDGGKRTLEKVRESGGLVQCVGVSWVLDCERENQWLDEAPYYIDTSLVPRGGARRRKSMEPRSIANLNGVLVPQPLRNSHGSQTVPNTPANNRRTSTLWVRSPEKIPDEDEDQDGSDDDDDDDDDYENYDNGPGKNAQWAPLTPVPKTPAPEDIARFVANISPGSTTPSSVGSADSEDPRGDDHDRQEMLLRTCPPKRTAFVELGDSILSKEKDERVLMRLMAARRKSLQFAPKVGSPLSKSWKAWN